MRKFGLIGKNISYSFSKDYFDAQFKKEGNIDCSYENFDLSDISEINSIIKNPNINGLNVTIPYKELVIPYLDKINKKAKKIGAVNTIKITKTGKLIGHNSDYYGFKKALTPYLKSHHKKALILGTGGASKAIAYAFKKLKIEIDYVSRSSSKKARFTYEELVPKDLESYQIIVNTTPLGTFPDIDATPQLPYDGIKSYHILFDLIYNPEETVFLKNGKNRGATIINGLKMLQYQANKSWEIWNS